MPSKLKWSSSVPLNSRAKGAKGEREIVLLLNGIIQRVLDSQEWPEGVAEVALKCIQRNLQQSIEGGSDLNGVFGLAIEIKRQENVQVDKWWMQCTSQAARTNEWPVLLYRKNNNPWRCLTQGHAPLPGGRMSSMRVQFDEEPFKIWFYQWVYYKLMSGDLPPL